MVIGIVKDIIMGSSSDITAEKKAKSKKLVKVASKVQRNKPVSETNWQKVLVREQDKFCKVIDQVVHDIRSPLTSLTMLVSICNGIQEEDRVALRSAVTRIQDIANNLQNEYKPRDSLDKSGLVTEKSEPFLVSTALLEILSEKKYQYKALNVRFEHEFSSAGNFAFTNMESSGFKRMLSNILNNAVNAVDKSSGVVKVRLFVEDSAVKIVIQDNGKGISADAIDKIMTNSAPANDAGHSVGLTRVRELLEENHGVLSIDSIVGGGTRITLIFPKIVAPKWIADSIELNSDDLVVILDDEPSIHRAWNSRFRLHTTPIAVKHFESGSEVINFITYLPEEKQKKVFLLTDYELINQNLNGLNVIEQTKIKRSVLVTSYYDNINLRAEVEALGTKLLPKMLALEVTIAVDAQQISQKSG